ncbi:MAG: sigma-54 dependent transcriptional regulator [Desulfatitalea sp.]|nr:sigma-54 dependent transcriptional regulator [Desulfatitalea sp.]
MKNEKENIAASSFIAINLVGQSPSFKEIIRKIHRISGFDIGVYIYGETGTGKEQTARALHYLSSRQDGPFIPLSCGGLNDELILNELFGHAKGAYTGAHSAQPGMIQLADKGTLFLDEIDSLTPKAQVALLRFLQDKEFKSLGSTDIKRSNTRIICAGNQDLEHCVEAGAFRRDLLYRLDILRIDLPPLRQRKGDVPLLANHFIDKYTSEFKLGETTLSPAVLESMEAYSWPGNIRELENYILKLCLLSEAPNLREPTKTACVMPTQTPEAQPADFDLHEGFNKAKTRAINHFEKQYLQISLSNAEGNVSRAARIAKKERRTFKRLLQKHGICRLDFRASA